MDPSTDVATCTKQHRRPTLFLSGLASAQTVDGNVFYRTLRNIQKYVRNIEMSLCNIQNKLLQ
jgi:hypothetical protein